METHAELGIFPVMSDQPFRPGHPGIPHQWTLIGEGGKLLEQVLDKPLLNVADIGLAADNDDEVKKDGADGPT